MRQSLQQAKLNTIKTNSYGQGKQQKQYEPSQQGWVEVYQFQMQQSRPQQTTRRQSTKREASSTIANINGTNKRYNRKVKVKLDLRYNTQGAGTSLALDQNQNQNQDLSASESHPRYMSVDQNINV